jgi:hypothetical protein
MSSRYRLQKTMQAFGTRRGRARLVTAFLLGDLAISHRNALYLQLHAQTSSRLRAVLALLISLSLAAVLPATADSPGRGLTRELEISYLRYLIDHHLSELRMTELAAGTLLTAPIPEIVPDAQTFPSPSNPPTRAKASLAAWWIPAPIAHLEFFARY